MAKTQFSAPTEEQHIRIQTVLRKSYLQAVIFLPILIMLIANTLYIAYFLFDPDPTILLISDLLMYASILTPLIFYKNGHRDNEVTGFAFLPFFIMIVFAGIITSYTISYDPAKGSRNLFSTPAIIGLIIISSVAYILCYLFFIIRENLFIGRKLKKREYRILEGTTSGENQNVAGWIRTWTTRYMLYVLGADGKTYSLRVTLRELRELEIGDKGYIVRFDKTKRGECIYLYYFVKS